MKIFLSKPLVFNKYVEDVFVLLILVTSNLFIGLVNIEKSFIFSNMLWVQNLSMICTYNLT